ncbi:TetR/AcrR family transcriptional regulator [Amycolatopsis sp. K13G38]|uniref:TetR/AcrR family transcriptional regulator n=1 Tax=Amycolatopsis acididurans TaxID=2724524 RepID=A0ABX1IVQ8_9PSEU|nr:TetR/AcrR family transcriptional regulator [Amycolatopsis acididurans]NKQ51572.1 TetR/AcrR family transcriptional regulator [Amycolatopsis acididurans]
MVGTSSGDVPASAELTRRDELLRIAGRVFAQAGYAGTSLRDIADAAGILTGSLYHHFPSKEALAVELISEFQAEMDELARRPRLESGHPLTDLVEFADKVGQIAGRHRAAVHMCRRDAPTTATETMTTLVRRKPVALNRRWATLLRAARDAGTLRAEVDLPVLQAVLPIAVLDLAALVTPLSTSDLVCSLVSQLLHGLTTEAHSPAELDASGPARVARERIAGWRPPAAADESRRGLILATARDEFARRGYEATTMRDIAAAAGMRASSIYGHFAAKQEILAAIMERFSHHLLEGYETVAAAPGTAVERLDGVFSLMTSAARLFRHEFMIVKDWWYVLNPPVDAPPVDNAARLRIMEEMLDEGIRARQFATPADVSVLAVALRSLLWVPLTDSGPASSAPRRHALLRQTLLDGAASPAERSVVKAL